MRAHAQNSNVVCAFLEDESVYECQEIEVFFSLASQFNLRSQLDFSTRPTFDRNEPVGAPTRVTVPP